MLGLNNHHNFQSRHPKDGDQGIIHSVVSEKKTFKEKLIGER